MSGLAVMMRQACDETNYYASHPEAYDEHRHVIPADEHDFDDGKYHDDDSNGSRHSYYVDDNDNDDISNCEPPLFATQTVLLTPELYNNMDMDDDDNDSTGPTSSDECLATSFSTLKRAYDRDTWRMYNRISLARHWSSHMPEVMQAHAQRSKTTTTTSALPLMPESEVVDQRHAKYQQSCLDYYRLQPRCYQPTFTTTSKGTTTEQPSAFGVFTLQSISDALAVPAPHEDEYAEPIFDLEL